MVIISAGFREIGAEGRKLEELVRQEQRKFDGMRILGPNCLGIIVPGISLNASFAAASPTKGHIGFISQSGALCTSVLDWALDEGIGFSYFVSVGNMLDVSMGDLIDYFGSATETRSIILYIESISEAREFMSAARAFARTKPIVAYKAGRFAESAQAAASHTGAMAGVDAVYEAAFQRAGIERIFQIEDMFDCAELLARQQTAQGRPAGDHHQRRRPGRDDHRRPDRPRRRVGQDYRRDDGAAQRVAADLLVARQPDRRVGRCPARPFRQGRGDRAERQERRRGAGDSHAAGDDRSDGHGRRRWARWPATPTSPCWRPGWAAAWWPRASNCSTRPAFPPTTRPRRRSGRSCTWFPTPAICEILHETPKDIPLEFTLDRQRLRGVFDTILTEGRRNPLGKRLEGVPGSL